MAIARQIKTSKAAADATATPNEKKIEALISKGGTSTKARPTEAADDHKSAIRLLPYQSQLDAIQAILEQMPKRNRPSRHAYILQAIDEKIERDRKRQRP